MKKELAKVQAKSVADREEFKNQLEIVVGKNKKLASSLKWTRCVVVAMVFAWIAWSIGG